MNKSPKRYPRKVKKKTGPARIWNTWDAFPFGNHKGLSMATVARDFPEHLDYWKERNKWILSPSLQEILRTAKNLLI